MAVFHVTAYTVAVDRHFNVDFRRFGAAHTVLEGVFHHGNEHQRCYFQMVDIIFRDVDREFHVAAKSEFHQFDVAAHEVQLLVEGHFLLVVFVERVAQQLAEFVNRLLCLVLVDFNQRVDVVERVEQEVRIQLVLQVAKFIN